MRQFITIFLALAILLVIFSSHLTAQISISQLNTPLVEDFNSMGPTETTYISGWTAIRAAGTGTIGATLTMLVSDGSSNSGAVYNAGTTAAVDRAFGTLASGTTIPSFGARYINNTGASVSEIIFSGVAEQWRSGDNVTIEVVAFEYSFDATSLSTGTWFPFTPMDLNEILTSTTVAAAVDGNLSANRTAIGGNLTGLNWANGTEMWIRWTDVNNTGADGLYAIDDFSITAKAAANPIITTVGGPLNFNNVTVGAISAEQTYTVSGSHLTEDISITVPSWLGSFHISLTSGSGFGADLTLTQTGGVVNPTTIYVRFAPINAGIYGENIVHSSTGAVSKNIAVSGTGVVPGFSVSPTDLNFGNVYVESTWTDSVTVTNTGSGNLNINSVYPTNNQFSVLPANAVIAALANQKFAITFAPTTAGLKSGYIVFLHDGATGRDSVSVSGTGVQVITIAEARALPNTSEVIIEGVITRGLGAFTRIQDATAGMVIRKTSGSFFDSLASGGLRAGDKIRVTGKTSEYRFLKQINEADLLSWERLSRDNPLPTPQLVTLAEIAANGEQYESELIKITDMIIDPAGDLNFVSAKNYNITDLSSPTSPVVLRTPNAADSDIDGLQIPTVKCVYTGVLGQFHATDPAAGYQLSPVLASDITIQVNVNEPNVLPVKFSLNGNYPNPFNPATKISFDLPKSTNISLTVYNLLGQKVKDLITNLNYEAGRYEVSFDASSFSTGVYLYKLSSPEFTAVKKMILSK